MTLGHYLATAVLKPRYCRISDVEDEKHWIENTFVGLSSQGVKGNSRKSFLIIMTANNRSHLYSYEDTVFSH